MAVPIARESHYSALEVFDFRYHLAKKAKNI